MTLFGPDFPEAFETIAQMSFILLLVLGPLAILATAIIFSVRYSARKREEMIRFAILNNQPEVAKALAERRSPWLLWLVLAVIAIVLIGALPWFVTGALIVVAAVTYKDWGRRVFPDRFAPAPPQWPVAPQPPQPSQPPCPSPETASQAPQSAASSHGEQA
jgi:hypothetical protein